MMKRKIFYIMLEKEPGKRYYLANSGFYFSIEEAKKSKDYQRAKETGYPISFKERYEELDADGCIIY